MQMLKDNNMFTRNQTHSERRGEGEGEGECEGEAENEREREIENSATKGNHFYRKIFFIIQAKMLKNGRCHNSYLSFFGSPAGFSYRLVVSLMVAAHTALRATAITGCMIDFGNAYFLNRYQCYSRAEQKRVFLGNSGNKS